MLKLVCAAVAVVSLLPSTATAADRPEILGNCSANWAQQPGGYGQSRCTSGTGYQKVKVYCYNGVDYSIEYGDVVGRNVWSIEYCNNNRTPVSATAVRL